MSGFLVGFFLLLFIIGMYFITYIANKNTDAPEGAVQISKCSTCGSGSCSLTAEQRMKTTETDCEDFQIK